MERLSWRRVQMANRRLIVRSLEEQFGKGLDDGYGTVAWPCPKCNNHPASTLRVAPSGMTWLAQCSSCGLDETRLIAAITGDK
jgi:transcription elongation factor Elf1